MKVHMKRHAANSVTLSFADYIWDEKTSENVKNTSVYLTEEKCTKEKRKEESIEEQVVEETVDETVVESTEEPVIETEEETSEVIDDDIPTVDKLLASDVEEEVTPDEPVFDETAVEDTEVEEPVEETTEEAVQSNEVSFAEVDNLDNSLSESNLAYLDKQDNSASDSVANADLKQDIKSVLLYMDQLLENLPEDKIIEFAKSDEFVTYKKLFSELGLS